jgi:hypothetical protein
LYAGPFIQLLDKLNNDEDWRALYGRKSPRLRDQEVVLRAIALFVSSVTYRRPLKKFLNDFVGTNRYLDGFPAERIEQLFQRAVKLINEQAGPQSLRPRQSPQINVALTEAVLVGLMRRLDADDTINAEEVSRGISNLLANRKLEPSIYRATADEESVRTRLSFATQAFSSAQPG